MSDSDFGTFQVIRTVIYIEHTAHIVLLVLSHTHKCNLLYD